LYALAWAPFQTRLKGLRTTVAEQHVQVTWMRHAAMEVKRLSATPGGEAPRSRDTGGRSLLTLVDQTARAAGLGSAVKRVEPQGGNKLSVRLEDAEFDQVVRWLDLLGRDYTIHTDNAVLDRGSESGRVNARLILEGSGA
jgi:general secretion pathway protein M